MKRFAALFLAFASAALAPRALAYPGGTPTYVTDVAPYCASCHSSVSEDQFDGVPATRSSAEVVANKHLAKIKSGGADSPYAKLSDKEREELVASIQKIDAATSVKVTAPASVKAGQEVEVTVEVHGGAAPVLGVALVDSNQRWQAAPATARGWLVLEKPKVTGPDGQPQTKFTDGRNPALPPGTTYVNVEGIQADPAAGKFSTVKVTWKLRAPAQAGSVPLAAVLFYGTELSAAHGAVETPYGKQPLGGFTGSSGRIRFSDVQKISVQ
jgi:cytochrome c553